MKYLIGFLIWIVVGIIAKFCIAVMAAIKAEREGYPITDIALDDRLSFDEKAFDEAKDLDPNIADGKSELLTLVIHYILWPFFAIWDAVHIVNTYKQVYIERNKLSAQKED